jgi:hypothetical protein
MEQGSPTPHKKYAQVKLPHTQREKYKHFEAIIDMFFKER